MQRRTQNAKKTCPKSVMTFPSSSFSLPIAIGTKMETWRRQAIENPSYGGTSSRPEQLSTAEENLAQGIAGIDFRHKLDVALDNFRKQNAIPQFALGIFHEFLVHERPAMGSEVRRLSAIKETHDPV
jgi:hypothetical protein